jgi:hypothetical protein
VNHPWTYIAQFDSAKQLWIQRGIVELSGKSKKYAWDASTSTCK